MKQFISVAITAMLWSGSSALAINIPTDGTTEIPAAPAFADVEMANTYDFKGILSLSGCSGSLVRFDDSEPTDKGLVLTNGHCVELINPDKVIINRRDNRSFGVLDTNAKKIGSLRASRLLYATMTKTDLALYELKDSFEEIDERFDISPLTLSRDYAEVGDDIEVISGYWKRGYSCEVEAFAYSLKEGDWFFKDAIRYSRPGCEVIGGTSGSPVILRGTRTVIAVNNSINARGGKCTLNNPCEISADNKITYEKGYGYAQQTSWLYGCRGQQQILKLEKPGCILPK
ncbi:MAG: hypothetical protein CMP10_18375 [Zetaproteobacteria bacterium]|nr:hypothetical protein [Pseudobdellovibrionaceae bacterium]|tara:strand:- start:319 stop:1179 length:861 start_codon:yes stop_codon:yes gene_type:complete